MRDLNQNWRLAKKNTSEQYRRLAKILSSLSDISTDRTTNWIISTYQRSTGYESLSRYLCIDQLWDLRYEVQSGVITRLLCRTPLRFHFLLIFAFLGRAGAHSSRFSPFFISFFLHFYSQLESPGSKNEEKMTWKGPKNGRKSLPWATLM